MPRIPHGQIVNENTLREAHEAVLLAAGADAVAFIAAAAPTLDKFDYLFPQLQGNPANLLPQDAATVANLKLLGESMFDDNQPGQDSTIPAAYTYFGQFVDHDITSEVQSGAPDADPGGLFDPALTPMTVQQVRSTLKNGRTATLDLDSLYGGEAIRDPLDNDKMAIGEVTQLHGPSAPTLPVVNSKGLRNDVPRRPRDNGNPALDRAARIGDPRNDENTVISQLQVAFLHAHNRLVDEGFDFDEARSILRQHYQYIVIHDFLAKRIADPGIVANIVTNGNRFYNGLAEAFMPLEFSVAAYRIGHTMVRHDYDFNRNFNHTGAAGTFPATLDLLFTFTKLSGGLGNNDTLPDNWIIEWDSIIGDDVKPGGHTRTLDTKLSSVIGGTPSALFTLPGSPATPSHAAILAVRNLLRGYRLRMPTGQAVADALGLPKLTAAQLKAAAGSTAQVTVLENSGFDTRTPLWYYVLAEAAHHGGNRLGPVGSTVVAEVLIGLVRRSADSILRVPGWTVALPSQSPGGFELADLLRFAGLLGSPVPLKTYVVKTGDTLSGIAKSQLGSASRWPEIFASNRTVVRNPDVIVPGMRLIIPSGPPPVPQLRFVVVKVGDTLSGLAAKHLGDASRWPEIFKLNGSVLTDPDLVTVGQVLQLPPK